MRKLNAEAVTRVALHNAGVLGNGDEDSMMAVNVIDSVVSAIVEAINNALEDEESRCATLEQIRSILANDLKADEARCAHVEADLLDCEMHLTALHQEFDKSEARCAALEAKLARVHDISIPRKQMDSDDMYDDLQQIYEVVRGR